MNRARVWLTSASLTVVLTAVAAAVRAENWPQFRGENGAGVSRESQLGAQWSEKSIDWKVELPGVGHSCPVIWGNRLFLTSAGDQGLVRYVLCLDARTGETVWTRSMNFNPCPKHGKSSWASSTPAVDGERVYVVFADVDRHALSAYDFDGKLAWRKFLGGYESQHAQGASPIVFEDLVILVNDQDGPSSIIACDTRTGRTVWSVPRNFGSQSTSYSTPLVYRPTDGRPQLICSSSRSGVSGLDIRTGRTIWTTTSLPARTVASPVANAGMIFQCCGGGGQGKSMVVVDPNGHGDVSKSHVRYERSKILPYVPTPIAPSDYVFLWCDHGMVCCMDPHTGKDVWIERLGGEFSSSPISAGGMLFNVDERGTVVVVSAGPQFKLVGKVPLGEPSHSTPAIANGRLYVRTFHHLACLESRP